MSKTVEVSKEVAEEVWRLQGIINGYELEIINLHQRLQTAATAGSCEWGQYCYDDVDCSLWHTACHEAFCFTDEGPIANGMKFCCYCGKSVTEHPYVDDENPPDI